MSITPEHERIVKRLMRKREDGCQSVKRLLQPYSLSDCGDFVLVSLLIAVETIEAMQYAPKKDVAPTVEAIEPILIKHHDDHGEFDYRSCAIEIIKLFSTGKETT